MIPSKDDWQQLEQYLAAFGDISSEYMQSVEQRPVASRECHLIEQSLSESGLNLDGALAQLRTEVIPKLSASRGSRYWGFVTGGATPVATLADWLVGTFDQNLSKGGD